MNTWRNKLKVCHFVPPCCMMPACAAMLKAVLRTFSSGSFFLLDQLVP